VALVHTRSGLAWRWKVNATKGVVFEFRPLDKADKQQWFTVNNSTGEVRLYDGRCISSFSDNLGITAANCNGIPLVQAKRISTDNGWNIFRDSCLAGSRDDVSANPTSGTNLRWRCGGQVKSSDWTYALTPV
jgi:hypothetical protein